MFEAAILGATGYSGTELVRLLYAHPAVTPVYLGSQSHSGEKYSAIHPQFKGLIDLVLEPIAAEQIADSVDLVFCALPHGKSVTLISALLKKRHRVIDLSADFRLREAKLYPEWYGWEHPEPNQLASAVYGLPELYKHEISGAQLVANPGCYPTSIILALAPLFQAKLFAGKSVVIDAKSGVSGAGRVPRQPFHFPDCSENFKAYRVADHQHTPEIEQEISRLAGANINVTFVPHLVPMVRGILSTIYLDYAGSQTEIELFNIYNKYYQDNPFVRILSAPLLPETRYVRGSNYCDIALKFDTRTNKLIIISAIDNLVRGASGQAVQNMNLMLGLSEETGLGQVAI